MDFYDATTLMRLVQAVENDPYVSSGAGEALADKVREFIEDEAEMGGWYTELMNAIGEGEITDPLADFTVGRFRVHLVQEGERYGAGGGFVYGKALSNACQLYGHGLPLVEFYDVSQDPAKFPEGQFVSRYFMSTLLGMDSIGDSIGEMSAFGLDGGVPDWTIRGDDLQEVYAHLCAAREQLESYTECGTYKDYGFGFHAKEGSMSSYVIGEPVEEGWWVLVGNYDLTDSDSDYFDNLITPDRVVYYDEERGRELNALAKLHLLRSHIVEPDLNRTIIRRPQCIVKSETAGQRGYRLASEAKDARAASAELRKDGTDGRVQDKGAR